MIGLCLLIFAAATSSPSRSPTGTSSSSYYTQWFSNQTTNTILETGFNQPFTDQYAGTNIYKPRQGFMNTTEEGLYMWLNTMHWTLTPTPSDYYVDLYVGGVNYASTGASATTQSLMQHLFFIRYESSSTGAYLGGVGPSVLGNSIATQFSAYKFRAFEPDFLSLCGGTSQSVGTSPTELNTYWSGCTGQTIGSLTSSSGRITDASSSVVLYWFNYVVPTPPRMLLRVSDNLGSFLTANVVQNTVSAPSYSGSMVGMAALSSSGYVVAQAFAPTPTPLPATSKSTFGAVRINDPYLYAIGAATITSNGAIAWAASTTSANLGGYFTYSNNGRVTASLACTILIYMCVQNNALGSPAVWFYKNAGADTRQYGYFSYSSTVNQACTSAIVPMVAGDYIESWVSGTVAALPIDNQFGVVWLSDYISVAPTGAPSQTPSKAPSATPSATPSRAPQPGCIGVRPDNAQ